MNLVENIRNFIGNIFYTDNSFQPLYRFYEIMPGIFLLEMDSRHDLAMTFLRVQEFYEQADDVIRGKKFTLEEYKDWYIEHSPKGIFDYSDVWSGFNVPSYIIKECYTLHDERLPTDNFFLSIAGLCKIMAVRQGLKDFYIIGAKKGATIVLNHEISHGLFATNPEYKAKMMEELNNIDIETKNIIFHIIADYGYAENVLADEAIAYFATGLTKKMKEKPALVEACKIFEDVFDTYMIDWKMPSPLAAKQDEQ